MTWSRAGKEGRVLKYAWLHFVVVYQIYPFMYCSSTYTNSSINAEIFEHAVIQNDGWMGEKLLLNQNVCWNWFSFSSRCMHRLVLPAKPKRWIRDDKHLLQGYLLHHSCCRFLRSRKLKANHICVMNFATKLWSTYPTAGDSLMTRSWNASTRVPFFFNPWMKPTVRETTWNTIVLTDLWDQ